MTDEKMLEEIRFIIAQVSEMGARSQSDMITSANYPCLLALRDIEAALVLRIKDR